MNRYDGSLGTLIIASNDGDFLLSSATVSVDIKFNEMSQVLQLNVITRHVSSLTLRIVDDLGLTLTRDACLVTCRC